MRSFFLGELTFLNIQRVFELSQRSKYELTTSSITDWFCVNRLDKKEFKKVTSRVLRFLKKLEKENKITRIDYFKNGSTYGWKLK